MNCRTKAAGALALLLTASCTTMHSPGRPGVHTERSALRTVESILLSENKLTSSMSDVIVTDDHFSGRWTFSTDFSGNYATTHFDIYYRDIREVYVERKTMIPGAPAGMGQAYHVIVEMSDGKRHQIPSNDEMQAQNLADALAYLQEASTLSTSTTSRRDSGERASSAHEPGEERNQAHRGVLREAFGGQTPATYFNIGILPAERMGADRIGFKKNVSEQRVLFELGALGPHDGLLVNLDLNTSRVFFLDSEQSLTWRNWDKVDIEHRKQLLSEWVRIPLSEKLDLPRGKANPSIPSTLPPDPSAAIYCSMCGTKLAFDSRFCAKCGKEVK